MHRASLRNLALLLIFLAALVVPQSTQAQGDDQPNPRLIKNINAAQNEGSSLLNFMPVGGVTYFFAKQGEGQYELWKTDGTPTGTVLVKDGMYPSLNSYAILNNYLYYPAKDPAHGEELWRTNLSTGETALFADIEYGENPSSPSRLIEFEGKIYFSANWGRFQSTDGTPEGTTHNGLTGESVSSLFVQYKNSLYFAASQWNPVSDDTSYYMRWFGSGGTGATNGLMPGTPLIIFKDRLYFTATRADVGGELWSTGGTAESIRLLRDTHPGDTYIYSAAEYNGKLYFVSENDPAGFELWVSDGTENGTSAVGNLPPGITGLQIVTAIPPQGIGKTGGLLLSIQQGGDETHKLWRYNDETFQALADLRRFEPDDEYESEFGVVFGGWYYFHAWDAQHGVELWRTDGTQQGTALIKDIRPGVGSSMASRFAQCGSRLCFSANDGVHGKELWQTDGTPAGTALVKDINTRPASGYPTDFIPAGDFVYMQVSDTVSAENLWRTNGTAAGTFPLNLDPSVSLIQSWQAAGPLRVLLGTDLIFAADDPIHGTELWKSDGTPDGTKLLKDLLPGKESSKPMQMTVAGDRAFFLTHPYPGQSSFWVTDGTVDGTKIVPGKVPFALTPYGNSVVINISNDTTIKCELWRTDGTAASAVRISDNFCLSKGILFDGKLYLVGKKTGNSDDLLWVMDSNASGIQQVPLDISPAGYYSSYSVTHVAAADSSLYVFVSVSDGRFLLRLPSGGGASQFVKAFYTVNGVPAQVNGLTIFGDNAAVLMYMYTEGQQWGVKQLWLSDGTPAGTRRVQGNYPTPAALMQDGSNLFITAIDPEQRTQIWRVDVQMATAKRASVLPHTGCAAPNRMPVVPTFLNGSFLMPLDDGKTNPPGSGCELWAYDYVVRNVYLPEVRR